jgi:hypothetical protein
MNCPKCGSHVLLVMNHASGAELFGTAYAMCGDQRWCNWKTCSVPMAGTWERDLERRVEILRAALHSNTLATATVQG